MNKHFLRRRDFLKTLTAASTASVTSVLGSRGVVAAPASANVAYDPRAKFDIEVTDVDIRRNQAGRMLKARIYRPNGPGPFPVVMDLHGGAWNAKDRMAEEPMDRAIASSGVLVIAIDMTLAKEAPYPASVQDANYGARWVKSKAAAWNGDASKLGIYGSSSGGHVAELLCMRPHDPRYNAVALREAPGVDATIAYAAMRSPVSDPVARYENPVNQKNPDMVQNHHVYFNPWDAIHEANPQEILDRHEKITLAPFLIMAGSLDTNVLPAINRRFAAAYKAAGGDIQFEIFEGAVHEWVAEEGPLTDRARAMVKQFIAEQLKT